MKSPGFTLIELSIVLVIIGLLVGGILTGKDLIDAARRSAQITQINRYNTAAHVFEAKYGYLPGDIPDPAASQFGFAARGTYAGEGDGDGTLQGIWANAAGKNWGTAASGETLMFWVDLSTAGLIEGGFNTATANSLITMSSASDFNNYFPLAKLKANNNYVYVYSGGYVALWSNQPKDGDNQNYFGISSINDVNEGWGCMNSSPAINVIDAYNIDKKIDDGLPQSGGILAMYNNSCNSSQYVAWAGAASASNGPTTAATPGSVNTCYDNGNVAGAAQQYSIGQNQGKGKNCGLSFQFQ